MSSNGVTSQDNFQLEGQRQSLSELETGEKGHKMGSKDQNQARMNSIKSLQRRETRCEVWITMDSRVARDSYFWNPTNTSFWETILMHVIDS